jgi:O-antigen/teichoic acid export membrane protein
MRTGRQSSKLALCSLAVSLLLVSPGLYAYLDPSTGSMVISAIVGIFASIALALKTYWYKIKGLFKGSQKKDSQAQDPAVSRERKQDTPE